MTAAALLLPFLAIAADVHVTPAEQAEETRWLASIGVKPPRADWPLADPFAEPFTSFSLVPPTAWYRDRPPDTLRADLLRQDIRLLHRIMQTAYGGWDIAKRRGWDWDAFFRDWDAALASSPAELSLADALAPWRKLMEFQLDNHSGPAFAGNVIAGHAFAWPSILERPPAGACTEFRNSTGAVFAINPKDQAQLPKKAEDAAGKPAWYFVAPSSKGPVAGVHCGDAWISARPAWIAALGPASRLHIRHLAQTDSDVPVFRSISPEIGYIRFPGFDIETVDKIVALERQLRGRPHGERLLIVDLRANGGGGMRISALSQWTPLPDYAAARRIGASCLYHPLRFGLGQMLAARAQPPLSQSQRIGLQRGLDDLKLPAAAGCPARFVTTPAKFNYVQHRYPAPVAAKTRILALVDNYCASDCELATSAIAAIPGSVIAGINTYGVAQFVQPGYFILPRTRLAFRIALGSSENYGDGRSFDGYGFDVDILLSTEQEMSADGVIALARRLTP